MDFSIIDPHTNAVFQQILSRIRRLQSGGTIDSLQDIGANTDHQIGASYVSLKELAAIVLVKGFQPEEETMAESETEGIPILSTSKQTFEITGAIYELLKQTEV